MSVRWQPDDPRWLSVEPDIQPVDLSVLRQVGVPEPILFLALRRAGSSTDYRRWNPDVGSPDLSFLDSQEVEGQPYWEDETSCRNRRW